MASVASRQDTTCATCDRAIGLFRCRGCAQDFCLIHTNEHREDLQKKMEKIKKDHDRLRRTFDDQTTQSRNHPLLKQIDNWEQQSIDKIRQAANDVRKQLLNAHDQHTEQMKEPFHQLSKELNKARDDGGFFEMELKEWTDHIGKLKKNLGILQTMHLREDDSGTPFISKIVIGDETTVNRFNKSSGDGRTENRSEIVEHGSPRNKSTTTYTPGEFWSGQFPFRFRIDELDADQRMFFGIVSKDVDIHDKPWDAPTTYGWTGDDLVYLNSVAHQGYRGYKSDMKVDDVFSFLVDCNRRLLRLTNERTRRTHELNIDVTKCPLPWRLNVRLFYLSE